MRSTLLVVCVVFAVTSITFAADFDVRDEAEFGRIVPKGAKVEKLATGMGFLEGPVWSDEDWGFLIFSDIPADELKKWTETGEITTFRSPSHNTNGNTRDRQRRLISCEHSTRRVTRTEPDGKITVLTEKFGDKRYNSPNDVVVRSDGMIFFTDPPYGTPKGEKREIDKQLVFRLNPETGTVTAIADDFNMPNGLCFSPDEKHLYIADSGKPHHIRVFDVTPEGTLTNGKVFATIDKGVPDGIRCDTSGRIFSTAGDGVHVFSPEGKLIGKILVPETPANCAFGGTEFKSLFITARTSLYRIQLDTAGVRQAPKSKAQF